MALPKQAGMASEIWMCLQNVDELWFTVEGITCSMFPFEKVKDDFETYLRSLLNGKYRLVTWTREGDAQPCRAEIQEPKAGEWKTLFTYGNLGGGLGFFRKNQTHRREFFLNETV